MALMQSSGGLFVLTEPENFHMVFLRCICLFIENSKYCVTFKEQLI